LCKLDVLCTCLCLAQVANCSGVLGVGASDQLMGSKVLSSRLNAAPDDKYALNS
jgi:hypothetical protein